MLCCVPCRCQSQPGGNIVAPFAACRADCQRIHPGTGHMRTQTRTLSSLHMHCADSLPAHRVAQSSIPSHAPMQDTVGSGAGQLIIRLACSLGSARHCLSCGPQSSNAQHLTLHDETRSIKRLGRSWQVLGRGSAGGRRYLNHGSGARGAMPLGLRTVFAGWDFSGRPPPSAGMGPCSGASTLCQRSHALPGYRPWHCLLCRVLTTSAASVLLLDGWMILSDEGHAGHRAPPGVTGRRAT